MTHFGEQESAGDFSPSLNTSKWKKENKNRIKKATVLGREF